MKTCDAKLSSPIEPLEPRLLLALVDGTIGGDAIVVAQVGAQVVVNVNGVPFTFGLEDLTINAHGGADTVTVAKYTAGLLTIDGGADSDTVTLGNGNLSANLPATAPIIRGGGGSTDTLVVDDTASSGIDYDVSSPINSEFEFEYAAGTRLIRFDAIATLRLKCSPQDNLIDVRDDGLTRVEVDGNAGNDELVYDGGLFPADRVDFNGGSGTQNRFDYTSDPNEVGGNPEVVVAPGSMTVDGSLVAEWSQTQQVELVVELFNSTWTIDSVPASLDLTAGGGFESFVGAGDIDGNILGDLTIGGGIVTINDTSGTADDSYTLDASDTLTKTGMAGSITFTSVEVVLLANGGDNQINVIPTDHEYRIGAGGGNDTIIVGDGNLAVAQNFFNSGFAGGDGDDTLIFDDSDPVGGGISGKHYEFGEPLIGRQMLTVLRDPGADSTYPYGDCESVILNAGAYSSTFTIDAVHLGISSLVLNAGLGDDELEFTDLAQHATVTFAGQGGSDAVGLEDSIDSGANTYTLTKTSFDKTGFGLLNFASIESLDLIADNAANTINIDGVASGAPVSVSCGGGNDFVNVSNGDTDANISAALAVNGDGGTDRIVFDDLSDTGDDTYTLNGPTYQKSSGGGTVTFLTVEHLDLDANSGNNTFNVFASPGTLTANLRAGNGNDTFNLSTSTVTTYNLQGGNPLAAPGDVLSFVSAASGGSATLTPNGPTGGTYTFAAAQPVSFAGVESFPTPPAAPSVPDLSAADDTGISNTDNITRNTQVIFTGTAQPGINVLVQAGGTTVGTATAGAGGTYSVLSSFSGDASYTVTAVARQGTNGLLGQPSAPLNVVIDTIAPPAPTVAPDLHPASDTGVSNTDNITREDRPRFTGPGLNGVVRLLANGVEVGFDHITTFPFDYSIFSSLLTDGNKTMTTRHEDLAGNQSAAGPGLGVRIDTVAPQVNTAGFNFLTSQNLRFIFTENVGPSLSVSDLALTRLPSTPVPGASIALSYLGTTATFTFPGFTNGTLPDGDYRADVDEAGITDVAGNPLSVTSPLDFFFLNGDANRDRQVNLADFNILSANFGQSGRNFAQGDFTYDGIVNLADFNVLAGKFGSVLSSAGRGASPFGQVFGNEPIEEVLL